MKYIVIVILILIGLYYVYPLVIGPEQVIKDVNAFVEDDDIVIQIGFSVPVRYENHFPEKFGEALQIKFRLISLGKVKKKEIIGRDALRPEMAKLTSLVNISYEGNVPGGPFLTLLFSRPVEFEVREDSSLQSLIVVLPKQAVVKSKS